MRIIKSVSAEDYVPSRPSMPEIYEFELVDKSNTKEPPICSLVDLVPTATLSKRVINRLSWLISKHKREADIASYYDKAYVDESEKINYSIEDRLLQRQILDLFNDKTYVIQFTQGESIHVSAMILAYSTFIEQETERCNRLKKQYSQRNQDSSNLALLNKLFKQFGTATFRR